MDKNGMSNEDRVRSVFLRDIAKHEIELLNDNGVYRHLDASKSKEPECGR